MTSEYKAGVKSGIIFYAVITVLTIITHLVFGWDYAHAPPASFFIILVALIVGIVRVLNNLRKLFLGIDTDKNKGEMIVHLLVLSCAVLFFVWIVNSEV
jgi:hypothetical protein